MGHYPTGVVVVTGRTPDDELHALVVGTFSSVSLDPPLVSFMPMKTSKTFTKLQECSSLCINIIGGEQENVVLTIARRWENKFDGIDWHPSPTGNPVLVDAVAWIETRIWNTVDAGDHWIVLCEVIDLAVTNSVTPLIFFQGGYGSFACSSLMARMDHEILPAITSAHSARAAVEQLANDIGCEASIFTTVSEEEIATVLSVTAPGVDREADFAQRVPMVPPIGDTYFFDQSERQQQQWVDRLRGVDDDVKDIYRQRLSFLREHGYVYSLLPSEEGRSAYDTVRDATARYSGGRLTPAQEREIRASLVNTAVDYRVQELTDDGFYDLGSIVVPVRDRNGVYALTLRLAQLPEGASCAEVRDWVEKARAVVKTLEGCDS
ncbi:flavin reductase family protein [Gordonia sp. TBRC 11910]|uniref:Flavin reductase family protein n=2 Tax=Gordonia asplenii TaxID=2725283 RepID=A0A848KY51_9ACTN|nr:flavin reductase family protein [Gordonia asplenii]